MEITRENDILNIRCTGTTTNEYIGANAIDFLGNLRDESVNEENLFGTSRYETFTYSLLTSDAHPPTKKRESDSGFDLHLTNVKKQYGKVTLYGTGVSVTPPTGFYFDLVPRSSMIKSGYMLANSVGIIDQGYTGEIMVALIKIDPDAELLTLPCKMVQLIPRHWYGLRAKQGSRVTSNRGDGGFGSTDKL
jgi:dUTP pyrophosphatase